MVRRATSPVRSSPVRRSARHYAVSAAPSTPAHIVAAARKRQPPAEAVKEPIDTASASGGRTALFLVTYVSYVAIYMARKPFSVVKTTLESEMGISPLALGSIDTSLLACYAVSQLCLGVTVGFMGARWPVIASYVVTGIVTAAFGCANSAGPMAALWGVAGLTSAVVHPLLVLFVSSLYPPSMRASAIGIWQTCQQTGGIFANTVASGVLATAGWRPSHGSRR